MLRIERWKEYPDKALWDLLDDCATVGDVLAITQQV